MTIGEVQPGAAGDSEFKAPSDLSGSPSDIAGRFVEAAGGRNASTEKIAQAEKALFEKFPGSENRDLRTEIDDKFVEGFDDPPGFKVGGSMPWGGKGK